MAFGEIFLAGHGGKSREASPTWTPNHRASSASGQTKSRTVIGYPSGQDGAILPARDYPLYPARKISPKAIKQILY